MNAPLLHHFSEDASIVRFEPHVPRTNPTQEPAVWAIDAAHAPLYWFPRDCPRATAWPSDLAESAEFHRSLATSARRLHAIETGWLTKMQHTELFRYDFDPRVFRPWKEASGQWVSHKPVEPVAVSPVGDLLDAHAVERIELRLVPNLWPVVELMSDDRWEFSHVRLMNALDPSPGSRSADERPAGE